MTLNLRPIHHHIPKYLCYSPTNCSVIKSSIALKVLLQRQRTSCTNAFEILNPLAVGCKDRVEQSAPSTLQSCKTKYSIIHVLGAFLVYLWWERLFILRIQGSCAFVHFLWDGYPVFFFFFLIVIIYCTFRESAPLLGF